MQLFQKLTNTAIPVSSGTHFKGAQSFQGDGSIRSGMTNDLNHIFLHANLYRFPLIICFVIHSISQPLFDCLVGIIEKSVRLCIANFEETDKAPYDCTICGISAGTDNQVAFNCTFGTGIGGSLSALTGAFGTDSSIYSVTDFEDGSKTVNYHFSNGLFEDQEIRVLAEPESKDLAELLTLQTSNDGDTITYMAMYYFRLPDQGEPEEE